MANNTLEGIDYEEREGMVTYMKANYQIFGSDVTMMKRLLKEREEEVFRQMEMEESKNEGIRNMVQRRIERKYHRDASGWLMNFNEEELYKIDELIDDCHTYNELMKRFVV